MIAFLCPLALYVRMDSAYDRVRELDQRLEAAGVNVYHVLKTAGIDRSTWTRWRQGVRAPRLETWIALEAEAERQIIAAGRRQRPADRHELSGLTMFHVKR